MGGKSDDPKKIMATIFKNVNGKRWPCSSPNCDQTAINSHLLQKNGIISNIAESRHVIEVKPDYYGDLKKGSINYELVGINNALSHPLFCATHDSAVFKNIEGSDTDYSKYDSQLLYSYRAISAELRKKEKVLEAYRRILQAKQLFGKIDISAVQKLQLSYERGIEDLRFYKIALEADLGDSRRNSFQFSTLRYPKLPVCTSAVFSLIEDGKTGDELIKQNKPWDTIIINLIPLENELIIIIGYHKEFSHQALVNAYNSWKSLDEKELQIQISDLIISRIESWCLSPSVFRQIPKDKLARAKVLWDDHLTNFYAKNRLALNLFDHS